MFTVKKFLSLSVLFAAQNILVGADQAPEVNELYTVVFSNESQEDKDEKLSLLAERIKGLGTRCFDEHVKGIYLESQGSKESTQAFIGRNNIVKVTVELTKQIARCKNHVNDYSIESFNYLCGSMASWIISVWWTSLGVSFIKKMPLLKATKFAFNEIGTFSFMAWGGCTSVFLLGIAGYKYMRYRSLLGNIESTGFKAVEKAWDDLNKKVEATDLVKQ